MAEVVGSAVGVSRGTCTFMMQISLEWSHKENKDIPTQCASRPPCEIVIKILSAKEISMTSV